ncbi:MAG: hypothetical protein K9L02_02430 [Acholeplasmataceae bacterium]|nr:hypothetical protein [Acholeplasmataceae bacterium]
MKKLLYALFISFIVIGLASCSKDKEPIDITVEVVSEIIVSNHIEVHVVVPVEITSIDELYEIALSIASQTYEKHFEMIETNRYMMKIVLYSSSADYAIEAPSYGQILFIINDTVTSPGLTIGQNDLIFE